MSMETLYPTSHYVRSNLLMPESKRTKWTQEENKWFESALAIFDKETPDRWTNVASFIPGKSVYDVKRQYEELEADISSIEAGLVPSPVYMTSSFTLELVDDRGSSFSSFRKRPSMGRSCDHERKKGVPWTEDEHRRFLMGLERHGKGDWRNISRNYVITKTPTQVASHAQKYYARQLSEGKEKRRPSIHDITMVHLPDTTTPSDNQSSSLFEKCSIFSQPHKATCTSKILLDWNNSNDGGVVVFDSPHGNSLMAYPFEIASHSLKLHKHGNYGPYSSGFQI